MADAQEALVAELGRRLSQPDAAERDGPASPSSRAKAKRKAASLTLQRKATRDVSRERAPPFRRV